MRRSLKKILIFVLSLSILGIFTFVFAAEQGVNAATQDISHLVNMGTPTLSKFDENGNLVELQAGESIAEGIQLVLTIPWEIPDTTGITPDNYFTFTINTANVVELYIPYINGLITAPDGSTIGTYSVDGNFKDGVLDKTKQPTVTISIAEEALGALSITNGYVSLSGQFKIMGDGQFIEVEMGGEVGKTPPIDVKPHPGVTIPGEPVAKYGYFDGGKLNWDVYINRDILATGYQNIVNGTATPAPTQNDLFFTDELTGGQFISAADISVYSPLYVSSSSGAMYDKAVYLFPLAKSNEPANDLFARIDKTAAETTRAAFEQDIRSATTPTIGVFDNTVIFINFGDISTGGNSPLNIANVPNGGSDLEAKIASWTDYTQSGIGEEPDGHLSAEQKDILRQYWGSAGINKGDFTSFYITLPTIVGEPGSYKNVGKIDYNDVEKESTEATGVINGADAGAMPNMGRAQLTKTDSEDSTITLAGAVFDLQKKGLDGTWNNVNGQTGLTTGDDGIITVSGLTVGDYRFVEVTPPDGYTAGGPFEFRILSGTADAPLVEVSAPNSKVSTSTTPPLSSLPPDSSVPPSSSVPPVSSNVPPAASSSSVPPQTSDGAATGLMGVMLCSLTGIAVALVYLKQEKNRRRSS